MRWYYRCPVCGAEYDIVPGRYLCDRCSATQKPQRPLAGILEVEWDGDDGAYRGEKHSARADDFRIPLPVEERWFPRIPVGSTPLWEPERLREKLGFKRLFLKDDTCNPTGSFKDRASILVAAFAARHGIREIALASTGNAASSMAGIGAAAGIGVTVFLPSNAPQAKRIQVLQYGATLRQVEGTYDVAFDLSLEYTSAGNALSRNTGYNPLTIEGKKSVSFEIVEQMASVESVSGGEGVAPLHVFVPVGDGVILSGVYRGFENLLRLDRIRTMPSIWACQADGSSAVARALESGEFGAPVASSTIADSIAVDVPRNGEHALRKLAQYGGRAVCVSDREILDAQRELASTSGLFAEPSSSAAFAGFLKVRAGLDPASGVVVLVTGTGLKDTASAARGLELF